MVAIEEGEVRLDIPVALPRPRRRGTPEATALEALGLAHLLRDAKDTTERRAA